MNPLVSVVIPTYNHAHFLGRALQSVLDQTYSNWEIIVVDNHSQDDTDEVMRRFADPRIALLKVHNKGVIAASRNMGIRAARGEWIALLDSDDWWMPNKLQTCLEGNNDADLIYHDLKIVREKSGAFQRKIIKSWQVKKPVLIDLMVNGNAIANSSVVVRKSLLDQIGGLNENPAMVAAEDYNAWLKIARITENFCYIREALGYYMEHVMGMSRKDMSSAYTLATAEFVGDLDDSQRHKLEVQISYIKGKHYYTSGKFDQVFTELVYCLRSGSLDIRLRSLYMIFRSIFGISRFN